MIVVRSCAEVGPLRNDGLRADSNSIQAVEFDLIANPRKVADFDLPRICDPSGRANDNVLADLRAKQPKQRSTPCVKGLRRKAEEGRLDELPQQHDSTGPPAESWDGTRNPLRSWNSGVIGSRFDNAPRRTRQIHRPLVGQVNVHAAPAECAADHAAAIDDRSISRSLPSSAIVYDRDVRLRLGRRTHFARPAIVPERAPRLPTLPPSG